MVRRGLVPGWSDAGARREPDWPGRRQAAFWGRWLIAGSALIWVCSAVVGFQRALLALTLFGFVLAVLGCRHRVVGPLGMTMLCTLDPMSRWYLMTGGIWRWNTFNYWLLVVIAVSLPFLLRQRHPSVRILEAFLLLLMLEVAFSPDRQDGLQNVLNILVLLGLLVYLARVGSNPAIWFWMACLSGVVAGVGGALFYLQKDQIPYMNENTFSFFPLTAVFALCLAVALPQRRTGKQVLLALGAVNAAWVFLSGSRGSIIIAIVCFFFVVFRVASGLRRAVWVGGAVAVGILAASFFGEEQARSVYRFEKLLDPAESLRSRTSGRSELALGAWYIFLEHPLGVGTGGFSSAWAHLGNARRLGAFRRGVPSAAHSGWMKVLAENGVLGIALLVAFVVSFAAVGWARRRLGMFPLGLLVTMGLSVAFLADEFQGKGLWFLAAGVLTLMATSERSRKRARAVARRSPVVASLVSVRSLRPAARSGGALTVPSPEPDSTSRSLWIEESPKT